MKDTKYIIADNVKLYRKQRNLTQLELAERVDLSVDSIKRGARIILLEIFIRIADSLDVSISYLLYESLNKIPITERIRNVLNGKSEEQQKYLVHMLEEMAGRVGQAIIVIYKLSCTYKAKMRGICSYIGNSVLLIRFSYMVKE